MHPKELQAPADRSVSDGADFAAHSPGDLGDCERIEAALRESEGKFRDLAEKALVGVYLIQEDSFQYVNAKFAEIFGYPLAEFPHHFPLSDATYPEDLPRVEEALRKRLAGELEALHYEFRIRTRSGGIRNVEVYSSRTFYQGRPAVIGTLLDITERKMLIEALAASEKRFRQLADATFEGICIYDEKTRLLDLNRAAKEMTGYDYEELVGREVVDFVTPGCREEVLCFMQSVSVGSIELQIVKKDGNQLTVEAMGRPIVHDGRRATVVALRDITERKRMEETLRKSEERYKLITDHMTDTMWLMNMELQTLWISPSVERNRGYSLAEINAVPIDRHLTPESLQNLLGIIAEELTPENLRRKDRMLTRLLDVEFVRKDGTSLWSEVRFTLLRDREGVPFGILGVGRNISERKQAEASLKTSEDRFSKVFNLSPIATSISTIGEGRYMDVNESMLQTFGYTREEMLGRTAGELHIWAHPEDRQEFVSLLKEQGSVRQKYFPMRTKSGEVRDILLSAELITLNGEQLILAISNDVTEQRKLEEQLRRSQKMEAIGTLAGGIAHDFNNILGGIMGYTELTMAHHIGEKHPAYPFLEGILRGIHRARDLVAQMMAFSRRQEQKRIPMQMGPIIKEALKLLRASLPATITIESSLAPGVETIYADPTQIHQVLMNLATNAAHAMKGTAGTLGVRLRSVAFEAGAALPHRDLHSGMIYQELTVSDTGCGMDPEILPRIFDPFFTTKRTGEGTGLGLSVVYGIVKSYDGAIAVESEPGKGSRFWIYLPTLAVPAVPEGEAEEAVPGGQERILFVDDELTLTEVFKILLANLGYRVTVCNDPRDALAAFGDRGEDFDLVITDMTMPHMTGLELTQELTRIRAVPVILCTGMIEQIGKARLAKAGIRQTILKPVTINRLAAAIRQVLDSR